MHRRRKDAARLQELRSAPAEVEEFLLQHSGLPGPRANLELASAFADLFAEAPPCEEQWWPILLAWGALDPGEAPTNSKREYLPFCAVQGLGAGYLQAEPARKTAIAERLEAAARDPRWRLREAACFAFQRIGEQDRAELRRWFEAWRPRASPVEQRALLVSLAHPPLLRDPELTAFALALADESLRELGQLAPEAWRSEEVRILQRGLQFAPSVFVAADPVQGFPFLERWADQEHLEIKKVVAANLRKARLARQFPDQVQEVGLRLLAGG